MKTHEVELEWMELSGTELKTHKVELEWKELSGTIWNPMKWN